MTKKKSFDYSFDLQQPRPVQSVEQLLNTATNLHQRGNLQQAELVYRQVIDRQPRFAYAMNMLGVLLSQKKEHIDGARLLQKAIKLEPNVADYHINLGFNLQEQGKLEEAEKEFVKATRLDPESADAWFNLGCVNLLLKKLVQANRSFKQAIEKKNNYLPAYNNLGNIYREIHRYDDALEMFNKVLELKPDFSQGWYNLGMTYKTLGDGENAVNSFKKALNYDPAYLKARCQAGYCCGMLLNDIEGANREFDSVIESNPDYASAYTLKGRVLLSFGRYKEAVASFRKVLELDQKAAYAYAWIVNCKRHTEKDIQVLLNLLDEGNLEPMQLVDAHFSLGSVYDERKDYESAFRHFQQGNRLYRNTYEYDVNSFEDIVSDIIGRFDKSVISQQINYGVDSSLPVFIIGMPRSGTTLVEQIIASHPRVYGAGELQYIGDLVQSSMSQEDHLASAHNPVIPVLTEANIPRLANKYLASINKISSGKERVTDKMPQNFLHLGYIAMMFPQARIVHCQRNPMDTCLSIYVQKFLQQHPYAYDLGELGAYYKQYQRLMSHWKSLLGDRIFTIQYEELVCDLEGKSRELIDHIGLAWDEHCLRFHETGRSVQTASHLQVRQNVYTTSRERWRNYDQWLGPLRAVLGDTD